MEHIFERKRKNEILHDYYDLYRDVRLVSPKKDHNCVSTSCRFKRKPYIENDVRRSA